MMLLVCFYLATAVPLAILMTCRRSRRERSRRSPPRTFPRAPMKSTLPAWASKRLVEHR